MRIRDFFKRGGGSRTDSSEKGHAGAQPDSRNVEIARQHQSEQNKREGFDLEEQMKRWAAEDDKDVKKTR